MKFQELTFQAKSLELVRHAVRICEAYQAQGYDLSLRQLYYQFVAANLLENSEKNYKRLGEVVSNARLAGLIDWEMISDRGRSTVSRSHWEEPSEILKSAASAYGRDLWRGQKNHVEVMVEKQALEGVLEPVAREFDVPFTSNKGYSSSSALFETGRRLAMKARKEGKRLHVIYLGDHDPSGIDMTRDVRERLELFSGRTVYVHRVALNMEQVEEYGPPENPAKLSDSRADAYIAEFGKSSWELDALEPATLAELVRERIEDLVDRDLFDAEEARQEADRSSVEALASRLSGMTGEQIRAFLESAP